MKHTVVKKERSKSSKKFAAFLTSLLTVAAAIIYILFGDKIALFLKDYGFDYNQLYKIFASEVADGELEVHIIDVGQGDSILVRTNAGVILIDAGTNSAENDLRAHLNACGIKNIDYFICTHPHEDHIGGADMVVNEYNIGTLLMPETDVSTVTMTKLLDAIESRDVNVEIPEVNDVYTLGDIKFTVLAPDPSVSDNANDSSIVIRLLYGGTAFMFTGDAEVPSEKKILETFSTFDLKCDFLKLGHHGSSTSTSQEFLDAVSPTYVAFSCKTGNSYGHPHREILERLKNFGIDDDHIFRTDTMGTVVIISDGKDLRLAS
ncbi:MAG: MBL fold metallo-hydrolase [Clostridiales bacterium]|nr:MBL fold metallo-hydrolase [Clostridiales bacterium]